MRHKSFIYFATACLLFYGVETQRAAQEMTANTHGAIQVIDKLNTSIENAVENQKAITLFMSGDVMTGRGIDQILPHPGNPIIHESFMKNAQGYVQLAEEANTSGLRMKSPNL